MDLSPSEASSPFIDNQADKCLNNHPLIDPFSNDPKPQFYQSEPSKVSNQKEGRGRRPILSAFERRERKILTNQKYRQEKMSKVKNLTVENSLLKLEYERLTEEIRQLKEDITWMHPNQQLASQDPKKLESYFSQSTSVQHDNKSDSVQFSGFRKSQDKQDLGKIISINEGVGINEYLAENKEISLSATGNYNTFIDKLLTKLDADDPSNVNLSDFLGLLQEKYVSVGRFELPPSLCAISQRIRDAHGDITATSKINPNVSNTIYVLFCATIKEMDDLQLGHVTEDRLLKWRDAIKDALRIGFQVEFALKHLKKIARAYIGLQLQKHLECMAVSISKLETDLKNRKGEHAILSERAKLYTDSLEEFSGNSVSSGLLP